MRFEDFSVTEQYGGFDSSLYEKVYDFDLPVTNKVKSAAEYIYRIFNTPERPDDYRGRTVSVSDVIVIDTPIFASGAFYCQKVGFKALKDLWEQD